MILLGHYLGDDIQLPLFWCNKVVEVAGIVTCATWATCNGLFYPTFNPCKDFLHTILVRILLIPHGSHAAINYRIIPLLLKISSWLRYVIAIGYKIESAEPCFFCPLLEPFNI